MGQDAIKVIPYSTIWSVVAMVPTTEQINHGQQGFFFAVPKMGAEISSLGGYSEEVAAQVAGNKEDDDGLEYV